MTRYRAAELTPVTINVHAGGATGAVGQVIADAGAHLAAVQEVRNLDRLRKAVPDGWRVWPGDDTVGTALTWDTDRFAFLSGRNPRITEGRGRGAPRLGWTPERRLTAVRLRDRITGRIVAPYALHTWAIGRGADAGWRREGHVDQVTAFARAAARHRPEAVVLVLGDVNEDLSNPEPGPVSALRQFGRVGLRPSFQLLSQSAPRTHDTKSLDEVFWRTRPFVDVTAARVIRIDSAHADHRARAATARIQPGKELR